MSNNAATPTEGQDAKGPTPPYISFKTLQNFVEWARQDGIPIQYDRSVLGKKYGGTQQGQLLSSLRFLGLLEGDKPTAILHRLVEGTEDQSKGVLLEVLKASYDLVPFEQLDKATPQMLYNWLKQYGIDGDTTRKAETFLVSALKHLGVPLSAHLIKRGARATLRVGKKEAGSATPPRRTTKKPLTKAAGGSGGGTGEVALGSRRTVRLSSGGDVTLIVSTDFLSLSDSDRNFVFSLVDAMTKYQPSESGGGAR